MSFICLIYGLLQVLTAYARRAILVVDLAHGLKHAAQVLLVVFREPQATGEVPASLEAVSVVGGGDDADQHSVNLSRNEAEVVWWQCRSLTGSCGCGTPTGGTTTGARLAAIEAVILLLPLEVF